MYLIPNLNMQEEVLEILKKIQFCGEPGTAGKLHLLVYLLNLFRFKTFNFYYSLGKR